VSVTILAFDTATPATAVALAGAGGEILSRRHDPDAGERPGHAHQLLPLIVELLDASRIGWEAVDRIAVGTGPGTFTGLRIGIATARALAQARELPLVGISTLQALAAAAQRAAVEGEQPLLVAIDGGRGEAFVAAWRGEDMLLAPVACTPDQLAEHARGLGPKPLAIGTGALRFRGQLEAVGAAVPADDSALHRVDAVSHCRLALAAPPVAREAVEPHYLRLPDAEIALQARREQQPS
jgi:tRNA threonylcarbamoyladenosine biosynthesis protein TsaB